MYCAALTYHPNVGTFRGTRGAWRVAHCSAGLTPDSPFVNCSQMLVMEVPRQLRVGTWVNPTKLLRELLASRRQIPTNDRSTT